MKEISIKEIQHLADLSALKFTDEELGEFIPQFNRILEMINQIEKANVENAVNYENAINVSDLREDEPKAGIDREIALQNSPRQRKGCFNVPKVVD